MSMEGYVKLDVTDGLATIVFFHPKGNSMPSAQLARLADAIREAGENEQARLILLKSDGEKAFCAGGVSPLKGETTQQCCIACLVEQVWTVFVGCVSGFCLGDVMVMCWVMCCAQAGPVEML